MAGQFKFSKKGKRNFIKRSSNGEIVSLAEFNKAKGTKYESIKAAKAARKSKPHSKIHTQKMSKKMKKSIGGVAFGASTYHPRVGQSEGSPEGIARAMGMDRIGDIIPPEVEIQQAKWKVMRSASGAVIPLERDFVAKAFLVAIPDLEQLGVPENIVNYILNDAYDAVYKAIQKLQAGYNPRAVDHEAIINKWYGPGSAARLVPRNIKAIADKEGAYIPKREEAFQAQLGKIFGDIGIKAALSQ